MQKYTKFVQTNIIIALIAIIIAIVYPLAINNFVLNSKIQEARSVLKQVKSVEDEYFAKFNKYKAPMQNGNAFFAKEFNYDVNQLAYYDYVIKLEQSSYTLIAKPKLELIKSRSIEPKILIYTKNSNGSESSEW